MSDAMYNETPVVGTKYNFGDWKLYAVHSDKEIKGFFGEYRWLSNFWNAPVVFDVNLYTSSECAYQAAKVQGRFRKPLIECNFPVQSKKLWKTLPKIEETNEQWDSRKYEVMAQILFSKFLINKDLRQKLLDTGNR